MYAENKKGGAKRVATEQAASMSRKERRVRPFGGVFHGVGAVAVSA